MPILPRKSPRNAYNLSFVNNALCKVDNSEAGFLYKRQKIKKWASFR
jgi:hypothetical protein